MFRCSEVDNNTQTSDDLVTIPGFCLPEAKDKYINMDLIAPYEEKDCQLPYDVLKSISTFGLIQHLLDYPLLPLYYLASSNSSPVGTCYRIYPFLNSMQEFDQRDDRSSSLLSYFDLVCFDCFPTLNNYEQLCFVIQLTALEVLFTKQEILQQLDNKQKKQLVALLLQKYKQQIAYKVPLEGVTCAVITWIMYEDKYPPVIKYYDGKTLSKEWFDVLSNEFDNIILFAENYSH
jgi:hypothetical protein